MSKRTKWVLVFTAAVMVLASTAVMALESTELAVPFRTRVQEILDRYPEVKAEIEALQEEYGIARRSQSRCCGWGPSQRHMGRQRQMWAQ